MAKGPQAPSIYENSPHAEGIEQAADSSQRAVENVAAAPGGSAWRQRVRDEDEDRKANARFAGVTPFEGQALSERHQALIGQQFAGASPELYARMGTAQPGPDASLAGQMTRGALQPLGAAAAGVPPVGGSYLRGALPWGAGAGAGMFEGPATLRAQRQQADAYHAASGGGIQQAQSPYSKRRRNDDDD